MVSPAGEEDEDDRKRGSSGTEYDDIEGQANGISPSQTHHDDDLNLPLLPKRPENILGTSLKYTPHCVCVCVYVPLWKWC